jgi:mannosyltransferase OCH1-like enzyme
MALLYEERKSMIPRIIHQTWKDNNLPAQFEKSAESWRTMHPDWTYCFWSDEALAAFVREHYPGVWPLYKKYPDEIQRVDAARYMILHHYGGIYSDLDIVCIRPMDSLLEYGCVLAPTSPAGFSNDLMMAEPGHPLFKELVECLPMAYSRFQWPFILRHFRVMLTTGPLFLTMVARRSVNKADVHYLSADHYSSQDPDKAYVLHIPGDTWAEWDTHLIKFIFRRWKILSGIGTALALLIFLAV